jgi:phosphatidylinositol alpha-mannosyltransferase
VATNIDGFRWVVHSGREGILVDRKDKGQLASALRVLIKDEALRRDMGQAGQRTVVQYDWERVTGAVLEVYRQAAAGAQPAPARELEPTLSPN